MAAPTREVRALALILGSSGVVHLVRPQTYEPIMPDFVPAQREVIYASGVAEILCAIGLLHPRTRSLAGYASSALLLGVYPANLKMAKDAMHTDNRGFKAVALARLPLQLPMLRTAWKAARARG